MVTINDDLQRIKMTHSPGAMSEAARIELGGLGGYHTGDSVEVSVGGELREFVVDGMSNEVGTGGWAQVLDVLSPMWLEGKKSPKMKQIFMTLSRAQYDSFMKDYAGGVSGLEYNPRIRIGDEFGEGGWDSNQIIETLGKLAGVTVHSGLPPYWVKQFTVEPKTTLLSAIKNIVSPMDPLIYSVAGKLFITGGGVHEDDFGAGNAPDLSAVRLVREEVVRKDRPSQLRLHGNLGRFRPERFQGTITSEAYQRVLDRVGRVWLWNYAYGTKIERFFTEASSTTLPTNAGVNASVSGTNTFSRTTPNPLSVTYDIDSLIVNGYSLEEVSTVMGKDIYGNASFTLNETRSTYKYQFRQVLTAKWLSRVLYSRAKTAYLYENTHLSFAAPREYGNTVGQRFIPNPGRIHSMDQMVFYPSGGQVVFGLYKDIEGTITYYWYTPEGELAGHTTTTWGVVYTDDNVTYKRLMLMNKDDVSPNGVLKRMITKEESVSYTQVSRDSYGMRRTVTRLEDDGRYHTDVDTQIVQAGAVQGSPVQYRKMNVYAETGSASHADANAVADTPAMEIFVNTPSWGSMENLLSFIGNGYGKDEVLRTYEIIGELNVHIGLQIDMSSVANLDGSEQIPAPALDPDFVPVVVGYTIDKDVTNGRATTTLIVRGRLQ